MSVHKTLISVDWEPALTTMMGHSMTVTAQMGQYSLEVVVIAHSDVLVCHVTMGRATVHLNFQS